MKLTFIMIFAGSHLALAQGDGDRRRTNLELMQASVQAITEEIVAASRLIDGDSVSVSVASGEYGWIAEQAIMAKLKSRNLQVFLRGDDPTQVRYALDVKSSKMEVRYENMIKDGLLGTKRTEREIIVVMSGQVENTSRHEVLYSGLLSKSFMDTLDVDEIDAVEHKDIKITHSDLPPDDFLDRIIEPFVIIGAAGAAIFLLFHVRS